MKKKNRIWIYVTLAVGLLVKVGIFILIIAGRGKGREESQNFVTDPVYTFFKTAVAGSTDTLKELPRGSVHLYSVKASQSGS